MGLQVVAKCTPRPGEFLPPFLVANRFWSNCSLFFWRHGRDFSYSSGIIPDVVEMRSRTGPPFIALMRYKIAKLIQETMPAQKSAVCLFACFLFLFVCLVYYLVWGFFCFVLCFFVFFQQEIVHLGFAHARPQTFITTGDSACSEIRCGSLVSRNSSGASMY